jgi:hypothetical protein
VGAEFGDEAGEAGGLETELQAVLQHIHAFDQELQ